MCLYGHLEGWSWGFGGQPTCGYAKCTRPAVFTGVPRVGVCCLECAPRPKVKFGGKTKTLAEVVAANVAERRRAYERET